MPDPVRIQVRCSEDTANKYGEAASAFGLTYGAFAWLAANYVLENRDDFKRFIHEEGRRRSDE